MKYALALLLLCSCANTDLAPDEFGVTFGVGDTDTSGKTGYRDTTSDSDSQWMSVGWTWYIGKDAPPTHETAYLDKLYEANPEPVVVAPQPETVKAKEPPKEHGGSSPLSSMLPYLPALALAIIGLLNRLGKVDWLEHKGHSNG